MHIAFDCRAVLKFRTGGKNQPLPKITVSQMSNALDITIDSANYHIKKMKKRNLITHCGSTKNGYWEIISNALSGE